MQRPTKKELFTIPNLMGYFRIIVIPIFLLLYAREYYLPAFILLALSYLSDFLDGKIARRWDMVTELGKALDPLADKLTQGVMAIALLLRYPMMLWFLLLFVAKELYMAVMGAILIRRRGKVEGAHLWGKLCTALLDVGVLVLLLFPQLSYLTGNVIIIIMMAAMAISLLIYIPFHLSLLREDAPHRGGAQTKKHCRWLWLAVPVLLLAYIVAGVMGPYFVQPEVSQSYQDGFDVNSYYSDTISCDTASLVEDNMEALAQRIRMIESAEERVILSTFDFRADTAGTQVIAALLAAANRGVEVRILVDGVSGVLRMGGNPYFYALATAGNVTVKRYNPLNPLAPWTLMSRLHDKYLIVDDSYYLLGGRNTFDNFLGDGAGDAQNYDREVLVCNTGGTDSSLYELERYFETVWALDCCRTWQSGGWTARLTSVRRAAGELEELYSQMRTEHPDWFEMVNLSDSVAVRRISLLYNPIGLYAKEPWAFYGLCQLMSQGEDVLIHTPYIICNGMMYDALADLCGTAAVTVMTNSSLNNGNPFGAADYFLHRRDILNTGVEILEYNGGLSYHGKSVIVGEELAIVGSFNFDMKSVYQDTELMLVVCGEEFAAQLEDCLTAYHTDARDATETENLLCTADTPVGTALVRNIVRLLDPFIRFLL